MEIISGTLSLNEKLEILSDAAKYDVACTSSGSDRRGQKGKLGNSVAAGVCHSFAGDGRCISLLKILQSNDCIYNCKYCLNRKDNDRIRTTFTPEEICTLVVEFYKRNYIEGLFLSSGVVKNPTYTMELIYQTVYLLRTKYQFNGYIHVKAIPYAPAELIEQTGCLVDRMSINLELPTADGLETLAPQKSRSSILLPMRQIQNRISAYRLAIGKSAAFERSRGNRYLRNNIFEAAPKSLGSHSPLTLPSRMISSQNAHSSTPTSQTALASSTYSLSAGTGFSSLHPERTFVPAGQSTQMIIGATAESDYEILATTQALYQQFDLRRVFFSAYVPLNEDSSLPSLDTAPPLLREHRLYQADWLLRYYGFHAEELLSADKPYFNLDLDPKCDWALRHLESFPIEIMTADYASLMRIPGVGAKSAMRIIQARRTGSLDFQSLKKIGVVLKRAQYFITCNGKMMRHLLLEENFITRQLLGDGSRTDWDIAHPSTYQQLSLFDY